VSATCPSCRRSGFPPGSRFCAFCGGTLPDRPEEIPSYTPTHLLRDVLESPGAREGERKEVTLLFADIAGSLAMAHALDPEDIHEIMDGFFGLALGAIHRERGTINQFRGDGFMALFGAPRARGEDVGRALRAALAIREGVASYGASIEQRFRVPLRLRMGLHTGTVWVGTIGIDLRRDYTAEGPTVGLAARLERAARPGQILISAETARRAERDFDVRELRPRRFRGAPGTVRVFELVAARPEAAGAAGARAPRVPFVGRERELRWLARVTDSARTPARVEISGEAGIGKSRLVQEHVARLAPTVALLALRCRESERSHAYSPWLELLARWPAPLPGSASARALCERFGGAEGQMGGTPEVFAAELAELLAGVAAAGGGLQVVIDDAQWLDPTSARVLDLLCADARLRGVAFLLTLRSEIDAPDRPSTPVARLELGPLAPRESEEVCRSILAGLDGAEALAALSVQRGAGNPLFLEEVARSLRDGPAEGRRVAQLEVEVARSDLRVPDTLRGVIAARIDALPARPKELVLAASVIGAPFDGDLLREIAPPGDPRTERELGDLVERGLFEPAGEGRLEFRHVLVREVAYAQLLLARRRQLHEGCAHAFVKRGLGNTADGAAHIGQHFERAGLLFEAAQHLAAAGRAYLRVHAGTEAAAHLKRAWELLRADNAPAGARVPSGLALAAALNGLDRAREAGLVLEELVQTGLDLSDGGKVARACIESGWVAFSERGEPDTGRQLLARGLEMARAVGDARLELAAQAYLVRLYDLDGAVARAIAAADRVFELASALDDGFYRTLGLGSKASALCHRGDVEQALASGTEAVRLAEASKNDIAIGLAQSFLAEALVYRGDVEGALRAAARARAAGERSRQAGALYHAELWSAEAYLLDGRPERALEHLERMSAINASWPSSRRAAGLLAAGRHQEAAETAADCLARHPPKLVRARTLCVFGVALARARNEDPARALMHLREAIEVFERLELRPHLAEAEGAMAEALGSMGELEASRRHAERAARLYQGSGMPLHAARALRAAGSVSL
jgi:class 3 adenylate cyclase/tetratricopeptide (TPR) repeat protein